MQLAFDIVITALCAANLVLLVTHGRTIKTFSSSLTSVRKVNQHGS